MSDFEVCPVGTLARLAEMAESNGKLREDRTVAETLLNEWLEAWQSSEHDEYVAFDAAGGKTLGYFSRTGRVLTELGFVCDACGDVFLAKRWVCLCDECAAPENNPKT